MIKQEEKYCQRCGVKFECKAGSIELCQCKTMQLSVAEREYLSERYNDCLCVQCMKALKEEFYQNSSS